MFVTQIISFTGQPAIIVNCGGSSGPGCGGAPPPAPPPPPPPPPQRKLYFALILWHFEFAFFKYFLINF